MVSTVGGCFTSFKVGAIADDPAEQYPRPALLDLGERQLVLQAMPLQIAVTADIDRANPAVS
jgi:hypothetical protein